MKRARPVRGWALVEHGKLCAGLIYEGRIGLRFLVRDDAGKRVASRRIARVEIREVKPKRRRRDA